MRQEIEAELLESIHSGKFSERELINLYNNLSARGSSAVMPAIKTRMRIDFPRAATRMFGAKDKEASALLEEVFQELSALHDLTGNRLKNGVRAGSKMVSRKKYIDVFIAYKNSAGVGAYLGLAQDSVESELIAVVGSYKAADANCQDERIFALHDIAQAIDSYKAQLAAALPGA
ncbi:MAG: hypothetical protein PHY45_13075 [Rhodocyclaceae bacterium]|nr:hypothetical protein [Rhodocyclaceae bacterium]